MSKTKSKVTKNLGKFVNKLFSSAKIKSRSHDIFFSWTLDLLLIKSSKYLVFGVYFSPHQRNIICEYELHGKPIMKWRLSFALVSDTDVEKTGFFNEKLKLLMDNF